MKHLTCTETALVSRLPLIFSLCTKNVFPLLCASKQNLLGSSREMTTLAEKKKKKKKSKLIKSCEQETSASLFPGWVPAKFWSKCRNMNLQTNFGKNLASVDQLALYRSSQRFRLETQKMKSIGTQCPTSTLFFQSAEKFQCICVRAHQLNLQNTWPHRFCPLLSTLSVRRNVWQNLDSIFLESYFL